MSKLDARSFVRRGDGLFPVDIDAIELLRMIPEERELRVTVRQPRNPRHSARFHVMMRKTMENIEAWSARSYDEFLDAIKIAVGHTDTYLTLDGEIHKRPKSIDFGSMDEVEFKRFERRVLYVINQTFGFDPEGLMAEVDAETAPVSGGSREDGEKAPLVIEHDPTPASSEVTHSHSPAAEAEGGAGRTLFDAEQPMSESEPAAGASPEAIPSKEAAAPAAEKPVKLTQKARETLRKYHLAIGNAIREQQLSRGSTAFISDHKVEEGTPLFDAMSEVYKAHLARVRGESSSAECDAVASKVAA